MNNLNKATALRIKEYRYLKGIPQKYLAQKLHISLSSYNKIENGITLLTLENLGMIADAFEVAITEFLPPPRKC